MVRTAHKPERKTVPKQSSQGPKSIKSQKPPLYNIDSKDLDRLHGENQKLVNQLLDFTSQMDMRIEILRNREHPETTEDHIAMSNNPELKEMMEQLGSKSKKIKGLQHAIDEMYRRLESSYKIDRVVEMENKLVDYHRINDNQIESINDLK